MFLEVTYYISCAIINHNVGTTSLNLSNKLHFGFDLLIFSHYGCNYPSPDCSRDLWIEREIVHEEIKDGLKVHAFWTFAEPYVLVLHT